MAPNTDRRTVIFYSTLLLMATILIMWVSRPTIGSLPETHSLPNDRLDPNRQVLSIRVDSLTKTLDAIQRANPGSFSWNDEGDAIQFQATDEKQFDQLLLEGHTLTEFASLKQPVIKVNLEKYGFNAPINEQNGVRAVKLPAHIIQSIHLHR
ncbi:hypothetical protein [Spirosoma litoris]